MALAAGAGAAEGRAGRGEVGAGVGWGATADPPFTSSPPTPFYLPYSHPQTWETCTAEGERKLKLQPPDLRKRKAKQGRMFERSSKRRQSGVRRTPLDPFVIQTSCCA